MVYSFEQWVGKEVFVCYEDEGRDKSGFFILLTINENYVAIKTKENSGIVIPISQLKKIKLKGLEQ